MVSIIIYIVNFKIISRYNFVAPCHCNVRMNTCESLNLVNIYTANIDVALFSNKLAMRISKQVCFLNTSCNSFLFSDLKVCKYQSIIGSTQARLKNVIQINCKTFKIVHYCLSTCAITAASEEQKARAKRKR